MILWALCAALAQDAEPEAAQHAASYTLMVANRSTALDAIVEETERLGGWFASLVDDERVALRVPSDQVAELLSFVEGQGLVAARDQAVVDVRRELAEVDARIQTRRDLVAQYTALIGDASVKNLVHLEREIQNNIAIIEQLEGRRRWLLDGVRFARVDVSFRFRDRSRNNQAQPSAFGWINGLDVRRVEDELRDDIDPGGRRPGVGRVDIDGFAVYRTRRAQRASSPDGVVYRARAVRHKPRADVAFWVEAIQAHLAPRGYTLLGEASIGEARWLTWGVPVGEQDHVYGLLVRTSGGRLDLIEVAGASEAFVGHQDAILDAVRRAVGGAR